MGALRPASPWAGALCAAIACAACVSLSGCMGSDSAPTCSAVFPDAATEMATRAANQIESVDLSIPDPLALPAETLVSPYQLDANGEDAFFAVMDISDDLFARMQGKTYPDSCTVSRDDLRYVRTLHVNQEGDILTGEIVVNAAIADEICEIFRELFDAGYPIERMRLADDYDADDIASMQDNNSSGFCFRPIEGTATLSNHARGMAIDINTLYNPYHRFSDGYTSPPDGAAYLNRSQDFPYKIERGDLCYRLFKEHGYDWGGDWHSLKDYQHFEKKS